MTEGTLALRELEIVVGPPQAIREFRIGVDLPRQVSGYSEIDTVPGQMFRDQGTWRTGFGGVRPHQAVGFALAYAALHLGTIDLHSHIGVVPDYPVQSRVGAQFGRLADGRATVGFEFDERQGKFHPGVL